MCQALRMMTPAFNVLQPFLSQPEPFSNNSLKSNLHKLRLKKENQQIFVKTKTFFILFG